MKPVEDESARTKTGLTLSARTEPWRGEGRGFGREIEQAKKEYDALRAYQLVSGAMDGMPFEMDKESSVRHTLMRRPTTRTSSGCGGDAGGEQNIFVRPDRLQHQTASRGFW